MFSSPNRNKNTEIKAEEEFWCRSISHATLKEKKYCPENCKAPNELFCRRGFTKALFCAREKMEWAGNGSWLPAYHPGDNWTVSLKTMAGVGSAEQAGGLICITSPLEHFSITGITVHYTQVNTQPDFDGREKKSERLFGADIYCC